MYQSTKFYDHTSGFSCAFRQWRATSHCKYIHGYALAFKFVFETDALDDCNWVVDFGGLHKLREELKHWFDHTTLVAVDDPESNLFKVMHELKLIQMRSMSSVGCEAFARFAYEVAVHFLRYNFPNARVVSCEVSEHGANSAVFHAPVAKVDER